jgi:hypothetical protein
MDQLERRRLPPCGRSVAAASTAGAVISSVRVTSDGPPATGVLGGPAYAWIRVRATALGDGVGVGVGDALGAGFTACGTGRCRTGAGAGLGAGLGRAPQGLRQDTDPRAPDPVTEPLTRDEYRGQCRVSTLAEAPPGPRRAVTVVPPVLTRALTPPPPSGPVSTRIAPPPTSIRTRPVLGSTRTTGR